jgi:hypothetical protein
MKYAICASHLVLSVRPMASVAPPSSSATRLSSSHSRFACGATYQLPSGAPASAVPANKAAASGRMLFLFMALSPGKWRE